MRTTYRARKLKRNKEYFRVISLNRRKEFCMDKLCPKEFQDIELAHKTGFFLATVYFHKVVQHDNLKKGWITKKIIRKWHKKQPQNPEPCDKYSVF